MIFLAAPTERKRAKADNKKSVFLGELSEVHIRMISDEKTERHT